MYSIIKKLSNIFRKNPDKIIYLDDRRVLEDLDKMFPAIEVTPETSTNDVMYSAGQRNIIKYIKHRLERGK